MTTVNAGTLTVTSAGALGSSTSTIMVNGIAGQGWFLSLHAFKSYLRVAFFRGTSLNPVPPGASKIEGTRYFDIHEADTIDETQLAEWVRQAARLPGFLAKE